MCAKTHNVNSVPMKTVQKKNAACQYRRVRTTG
jgi:hypothetical protein